MDTLLMDYHNMGNSHELLFHNNNYITIKWFSDM